MNESQQLQESFGIPGAVSVEPGEGGLPRVVLSYNGATAHVYLHGAHVTHYQPRDGKPVIFMSAKSLFQPGKAIRGGAPIIFPWFGARADNPKAPQHGFARSRAWRLHDTDHTADGVSVTLQLQADDATRAAWPHQFEALFTVRLAKSLKMSLDVLNAGEAPFAFEEAVHTYFAVEDIHHAQTSGLEGRMYIDKVDGFKRKKQEGHIVITGETDRVYLDTPDEVLIDDGGKRLIRVDKENSRSTVVWNPWVDKAKGMSDFGPDEWRNMICVETANAADNAVTLAPGQRHVMTATIALA